MILVAVCRACGGIRRPDLSITIENRVALGASVCPISRAEYMGEWFFEEYCEERTFLIPEESIKALEAAIRLGHDPHDTATQIALGRGN